MKSYRPLLASVVTLGLLIWTWINPHKTWQVVVVAISFCGFVAMTIVSEILRRR